LQHISIIRRAKTINGVSLNLQIHNNSTLGMSPRPHTPPAFENDSNILKCSNAGIMWDLKDNVSLFRHPFNLAILDEYFCQICINIQVQFLD